jgi:acyl-CoA synthetase (AMP-forming)/AMP-acid ligase II
VVPRSAIDQEALRRHCQERLGAAFAPVEFVVLDALPRGQGGKLDRQRLTALASAKQPRRGENS